MRQHLICTYHFEDVLNKYGKVVEQRIVKNIGNVLQINKADMIFTRPYGKYVVGHKYIETAENFYITSIDENRKDVSNVFDNLMSSKTINDIIKYENDY